MDFCVLLDLLEDDDLAEFFLVCFLDLPIWILVFCDDDFFVLLRAPFLGLAASKSSSSSSSSVSSSLAEPSSSSSSPSDAVTASSSSVSEVSESSSSAGLRFLNNNNENHVQYQTAIMLERA